MNLRLISPELIVDISGLVELRGIVVHGTMIRIGALTRHVDILKSHEIATHAPLLRDAVAHVAHPAIRNRGTIGGNLAHADPASELPACLLVLGGTILVRGLSGERRIAAAEFFRGIFQTALAPTELVIGVEIPVMRKTSAHFFNEFTRRHGDYAIVGLAAQAEVEKGVFTDFRLGFFAVGDRPILARAAGILLSRAVTPSLISEASDALGVEIEPQEDQQASAAMRRHLAKVLLARAVAALLGRPELRHAGGAV